MHLILRYAVAQFIRMRLEHDARRADARVRAELATYTSGRERAELDAILGRHSADEIAYVEGLLPAGPRISPMW